MSSIRQVQDLLSGALFQGDGFINHPEQELVGQQKQGALQEFASQRKGQRGDLKDQLIVHEAFHLHGTYGLLQSSLLDAGQDHADFLCEPAL